MRSFKTLLLATIAASPFTATAVSAQAQSETEASEAGGDVIIVTARRQSERLQDVPASVSVLTADALQKTGADSADDFAQLTPGVTIVTGTAEAGDTQINIRGINGARDAESSVALVVDGILKTNTAQLNQPQGTLQQVEILKGPQGALYGRNAAAGAIVLQTLKPGDVFEGALQASYANENTSCPAITAPPTDSIATPSSMRKSSTTKRSGPSMDGSSRTSAKPQSSTSRPATRSCAARRSTSTPPSTCPISRR